MITGFFKSRREAEIAVEHLVQEHGLDRKAIQAMAEGEENSSGSSLSGGDAAHAAAGEPVAAQQNGRIRVSIDADPSSLDLVKTSLEQAGAVEIR